MEDLPIIAGALKNSPHLALFDIVAKKSFNGIEIENLLVFNFDTVDARLLDTLASDFGLLGYNGWILAETEQQKRDLLKNVIGRKKVYGTPQSIRDALYRLGFHDISFKEGWDFTSSDPVPESPWAFFRVIYQLPAEESLTSDIANKAIGLINNLKPARSRLQDFSMSVPQNEKIGLVGEVRLKIIDAITEEVLEDTTQNNLLTFGGMFWMLTAFGAKENGDVDEFTELPRYNFDKISFGTDGTPGTDSSPTSITSAFTKSLDFNPGPATIGWSKFLIQDFSNRKELIHYFSLGAGESNGVDISEIGLIMSDHNGIEPDVLMARITRAPISKTSSIKLEGTWSISFRYNTYPASS